MAAKVATSARGTATLGMAVARALRRKANTTATTSTTAKASVSSTSRTERRMLSPRSMATRTSMAGEMSRVSCGRSAFTPSITRRMLAPGCRRTSITTARCPSIQPAARSFSTPSTTSATSASRTGAPFTQARMSGR